jgi:hypothetical protein
MKNDTMKTFSEFVSEPEGESLFEMANLSPKRTGLPFVVWISPRLAHHMTLVSKFLRAQRSILPN